MACPTKADEYLYLAQKTICQLSPGFLSNMFFLASSPIECYAQTIFNYLKFLQILFFLFFPSSLPLFVSLEKIPPPHLSVLSVHLHLAFPTSNIPLPMVQYLINLQQFFQAHIKYRPFFFGFLSVPQRIQQAQIKFINWKRRKKFSK